MGRFCIGLDPASAELLKGLLRGCFQKTPVSEGNRRGQGKKADTDLKFQEQSSLSLISPAALFIDLHRDDPGHGGCSQAAPVSQEQSPRKGSGGELLAVNTLNNG